VLAAASLGPGYVYVHVAKRREPREDRSQILEVAELVVIGSIASGIAALAVVGVMNAVGALDPSRLAQDGSDYVIRHPLASLGAFIAILILGCLGAYCASRFVHHTKPKAILPGHSAWQMAFWHDRPEGNAVWATVELMDGRQISGLLKTYGTEPASEERELVIEAPIGFRAAPSAKTVRLDEDFIVLRDSRLAYISGRYLDPNNPPASK
jgi:hypothetical protein